MATKKLTDFETEVTIRTQDNDSTPIISTANLDLLINNASDKYSQFRPQTVVSDITGTNSFYITLPADWEDGFSEVVDPMLYPYNSTDQNPPSIDRRAWKYDWNASKVKCIRLLSSTPQTSETLRLTYTKRHVIGATADLTTIPDADYAAVCDLAASLVFEAVAAKYSKTTDANLGADAIDYGAKARGYEDKAELYRKRFFSHMGLDEEKDGQQLKAFSFPINWDQDFSVPPVDRMTHPRRWR